jgi:alkanesulfonate monooxygenase SsuD/methylene tetrahydromethanopterin reductase-like flavin-dependent oxidoreductase (luciferase family)
MDVGLGLWTMRSMAEFPAPFPHLYAELGADARLAETLGFHSLWIAEHHAWYDGWCPSPLVAASAALAATSTLHVGTGIHLLPLYDPERVGAQLAWLQRVSGGRMHHGVGLGYRDAEYDAHGQSRKRRGRRMDEALDHLATLGAGAPPVWVGGFAEPALRRAGQRGLGVMLPQTLSLDQLTTAIAQVRAEAAAAGTSVRIGAMRYAWVTDGSAEAHAQALALQDAFTREYWGAWFTLRGVHAFDAPDLLDAQLQRSASQALIGTPEELRGGLRALEDLGVELCVLHLVGDGRLPTRQKAMTVIAEDVLPALSGVPT